MHCLNRSVLRPNLGNSNCVPTTQSLFNRSPAGSKSASVNCRRPPRKDWQSTAKGAVLSEIPAPRGRSEILPCRLDRRGGASVVRREAVINRTEDLNVKVCEARSMRAKQGPGLSLEIVRDRLS